MGRLVLGEDEGGGRGVARTLRRACRASAMSLWRFQCSSALLRQLVCFARR